MGNERYTHTHINLKKKKSEHIFYKNLLSIHPRGGNCQKVYSVGNIGCRDKTIHGTKWVPQCKSHDIGRNFQHAHFMPKVGVGKERRALIGSMVMQRQHPLLLELP